MQQVLAKRYAELFAVYLKHPSTLTRVTFWGLTDSDSWLNGWPIPGRTSYPLLFDRQGNPKPALKAVIQTVSKGRNISAGRTTSTGPNNNVSQCETTKP
jgi:endo-1,4-beta-xylanase